MGMWCHILFICCLLCWYGASVLYFHLFGVLFSSDCLYMNLLRVNDESNRGDGSESGFGGSDNVEGAFDGEQDIPTDSSSTSRWRQKYHRQTPRLSIRWIDWMKSSKLLRLDHHRHLFQICFLQLWKWWW
ncbi:hypothetical protein HanIR_Chr07g0300021 [Helianthus annuus]|nr:hypothetical protein HanIR_Chr07g0300021 [Helianthus annuus]